MVINSAFIPRGSVRYSGGRRLPDLGSMVVFEKENSTEYCLYSYRPQPPANDIFFDRNCKLKRNRSLDDPLYFF
jgi:hypothetical protein